MQKDHPLFDDLAKLASGAAGAFMDIKREIEAMVASQVEGFMGRMNFASKEEVEALKTLASSARAEADALRLRVEELEKLVKSKK